MRVIFSFPQNDIGRGEKPSPDFNATDVVLRKSATFSGGG